MLVPARFFFAAIVALDVLPVAQLQRICELQGTCFRCEHNRYSFYGCRSSEDCFPEEFCNAQRFCCPITVLPTQIGFNQREVPTQVPRCPDDSEWLRMCKQDADCLFRDEICVQGKCCPSCQQKRQQVIDRMAFVEALPRNTSTAASARYADTDGIYIPQCSATDNQLYSAMQCRNGSDDCFCVTKHGRRIARRNNSTQAYGSGVDEDVRTNCTRLQQELDETMAPDRSERTTASVAETDGNRVEDPLSGPSGNKKPVESETADDVEESARTGSTEPVTRSLRPEEALEEIDSAVATAMVTAAEFTAPPTRKSTTVAPAEKEEVKPSSAILHSDNSSRNTSNHLTSDSNAEEEDDDIVGEVIVAFSMPKAFDRNRLPAVDNFTVDAVVSERAEDDDKWTLAADEQYPTSITAPTKTTATTSNIKNNKNAVAFATTTTETTTTVMLKDISVRNDTDDVNRIRAADFLEIGRHGMRASALKMTLMPSSSSLFAHQSAFSEDRSPSVGFVPSDVTRTSRPPLIMTATAATSFTTTTLPLTTLPAEFFRPASQTPPDEEDAESAATSSRSSPTVNRYHYGASSSSSASSYAVRSLGTLSGGCADPLREFKVCGSSCPISCATRTRPPCTNDVCRRGCFCRLPYVILDGADPFGSRCVLPAECPLLPFTVELNSGFFPELSGAASAANQEDVRGTYLPAAPTSFSSSYFGADRRGGGAADASQPGNRCADPLKNYLSCGSACPAGCGNLQRQCGLRCRPGCYCRAPYVLRDPDDALSPCVLPQHCPEQRLEAECNARPDRVWSTCATKRCLRSCDYHQSVGLGSPLARQIVAACGTVADECRAACECRPPYIWFDHSDAASACVLPEECPPLSFSHHNIGADAAAPATAAPSSFFSLMERPEERLAPLPRCDESAHKEFRHCATSCPLACDNLELRLCTPCASACFCQNGYVFKTLSMWRDPSSQCIPAAECPSRQRLQPLPVDRFTDAEGLSRHVVGDDADLAAETTSASTSRRRSPTPVNRRSTSIGFSNVCPSRSVDRSGRPCGSDAECGFHQKCCPASAGLKALNGSAPADGDGAASTLPHRCVCLDPNAVWLECGPACEPYCRDGENAAFVRRVSAADAAAAFPPCPRICRPGCFCASGFVRSGRALRAPCIRMAHCITVAETNTAEDEWAKRGGDARTQRHSTRSSSNEADASTGRGGAESGVDDRKWSGGEEEEEKKEKDVSIFSSSSTETTSSTLITPLFTSPSSSTAPPRYADSADDATDEARYGSRGTSNAEVLCGEALASAVLYARDRRRVGRLLVRPERRPDDGGRGYADRLIRVTGELNLTVIRHSMGGSLDGRRLFLAIHQFSDTTFGGCQSVGKPLVLSLIDEDENGFTTTTSTLDIHLDPSFNNGTTSTGRHYSTPTSLDILLLWPDVILPGTNPLIGHSMALKTFGDVESGEASSAETTRQTAERQHRVPDTRQQRMLACAVLGIVPSC